MVDHQSHATRLARAFGLFTLLAGIAIMHALVIGTGHAASPAHDMPPGHAATANHADFTDHAATTDHTAVTASTLAATTDHASNTPGCGDCDGGHAGLHGCVFVLTALLLGLGLALLAWVGAPRPGGDDTKARPARAHHARPPPWTVLTLADLAILRI
ncbi:hypothetical protein ACWDOP_32250 [Nocardia sp. NPDC003693]